MTAARISVVVATMNSGKLAEFRELFSALPIELLGMAEVLGGKISITEDGETFEQNALKKASAVAEGTMMLTLADDSGLEVDALGGAPGVRSARYAGERATDAENNAALLRALKDVPEPARTARFRCVLCLVDPWAVGGSRVVTTQGTLGGRIAQTPLGAGGFGYDPLFLVDGDSRTLAEFSDSEKNALSHRGQAAIAMMAHLEAILTEREDSAERISVIMEPPKV